MSALPSHNSSPPLTYRIPILQHLVNVYKLWQDFVQHFPKKSRYTLGTKIDESFIQTLELIFIAGVMPRDKKLPYVTRAITKFDLLKFFLRVAWEVKALDSKKYAALMEPLSECRSNMIIS